MDTDTIVAIATPIGEGGISIIRISGQDSVRILEEIFRSKRDIPVKKMKSRMMYYGYVYDNDQKVDEVLSVVMRKPYTYTREDVVEIHCHGGMLPVKNIIELCIKNGARMAEPGEFTKRAFINGRIDLVQSEAVMELIRAKSDTAEKISMQQLDGRLSSKINKIQDSLIGLIARVEVNTDYPEEDIEQATVEFVQKKVKELIQELDHLYKSFDQGKVLMDGLRVAIVGRPNVGKSSILNMLLRKNKAIVTEIPGTTRDVLEDFINIKGLLVKLMDTAGIRETKDIIESIGVKKTREAINVSDLVLLVFDYSERLKDEDYKIMNELKGKKSIVIYNKIDMTKKINEDVINENINSIQSIYLSARDERGLEQLEDAIYNVVYRGKTENKNEILITNERQKNSVYKAAGSLKNAENTLDNDMPVDLIAIDLRDASYELGKITGDSVDEKIIDRIFSEFCLGK